MKNTLRVLVIMACIFVGASPMLAQWVQTNGPYGSYVTCFAVSDTNIFAGTMGDGVFLSTNNGTSWTAIKSGLANLFVRTLAVSPNGTGGTNLFAGTFDGFFISTNNGTNWIAKSSGLTKTDVYAIAVSPNGTSGTNLFAATWGGGVFLSTNNGTSWTVKNHGLTNTNIFALAVCPDSAGGSNLFAGTMGDGVFLSTNNGTSWTSINSGLTNTVIQALATIPNGAGGTNLFAGTCGGGVFLSTNYGTSWTPINSGLEKCVEAIIAIPNGVGGTNLFAGAAEDGVFLSTDDGSSWTAVNSGLKNAWVHSLAVSPNGSGGINIYAGTRDGVFISTNNGANWTITGLPSTIVMAFAVEPDSLGGTNLFAGTVVNDVFLSTNNGTRWTAVHYDPVFGVLNALVVVPNGSGGTNLIAGTDVGAFLDSGTKWIGVSSGLGNSEVRAFAISPDGVGGTNLFAGNMLGVFLSTNNGTSWTAVDSGLTNGSILALAVSPDGAGGSNLFAGTEGGGVFLSTNNGTSWTAINSGLTNTDVQALAISPNGTGGTNLFAGTWGGGVFLSTDNGTSWTAVNSGMTFMYIQALAVSPNEAGVTYLFAGTIYEGVFLSTNNGTSWTAVNSGLTNAWVQTLAINDTNLFAGTWGSGVWRRPLSEFTNISPSITVTSPNDGKNWQVGSRHNISWTSSYVTNVIIEYSMNNGTSWNGILGTYPASFRSYSWTVPNTPSTQCKVKVRDVANPSTVSDVSNNTFVISDTGLIAYYPFNGNTNDESGNGRNGVNYGATLTTDRFGQPAKAYTFNGTNNYIDIPGTGNLNLTSGLALCAWVSFTEALNLKAIVSKHIAGYGNGYSLQIRTGTNPEFFVSSEPGLISSDSINDGRWHFLVGNYDGSTMSLYVDGILKLSQSKTFSSTNDSTIMIGKHHEGNAADWFNGAIDDIHIYNRPLKETEITALMSNPPVGVKKVVADIPSGYQLEQNYPNPFNPSTIIRFGVPVRSRVTLTIFDLLGRQVANLVDENVEAGYFQKEWHANIASGMYFYRIQAIAVDDPQKQFIETKKLLLLR